MGKDTSIAWTESTLNLAWGCTKLTEECRRCYMYRMSPRFGRDPTRVTITKGSDTPEGVDAKIKKCRWSIFVNSMSDTFHEAIPDELLDLWFGRFGHWSWKRFQVLTKRPERAREYFMSSNRWGVARYLPPNVWIGTSVGIASAKGRVDVLRSIPAYRRFLSCEPLLEDPGELDLRGIHWVIVGGESDDKDPRPMKPEWAESIRRTCERAGVPFFFKQMGGKGGSGAGGDLLNGKRYHEFPESRVVRAP